MIDNITLGRFLLNRVDEGYNEDKNRLEHDFHQNTGIKLKQQFHDAIGKHLTDRGFNVAHHDENATVYHKFEPKIGQMHTVTVKPFNKSGSQVTQTTGGLVGDRYTHNPHYKDNHQTQSDDINNGIKHIDTQRSNLHDAHI